MPTPWPALTRRVRSLARFGPLHRLEASKGQRARDLSAHDLRVLALRAIDATIEQMGLGYGARRRDLVEALAEPIRAMDPALDAAGVVEIADLVLDELLNAGDRGLQFEEPYLAFDDRTRRAVRFHLLVQELADDDTVVIKASTEAINLYAGMLDVDVEDAQTAAEAVLRAQLERGAIDAAVATATQARVRSIEFAEQIRGMLRQVRRDITRVDPRDMLRRVASARRHLGERLTMERELLEAVDHRLAEADTEAPSLVQLRDTLDDCRRRHLDLHQHLQRVNETWLDEQARQRFRRARESALPDLERDVLQALLSATVGDLDPLRDDLVRPLHGPATPKVFGLASLVDGLLAPRRREPEAPLDAPVRELEALTGLEGRFDAVTLALAQAWLAQGGRLAALLAASRAAGDPPDVRRVMVLRGLWAWDPGADESLEAERGPVLNDPDYEGDDLQLGAPDGH